MGKIEASKSGTTDIRSVLLWLAATILIVFVIYGSSLAGGFCLDDDLIIIDSEIAHGLQHLPQAFTTHFLLGFSGAESLYYRPLVTASFQLDYSLGGLDPTIFRVTNLILYLICAALVFVLALKLTESVQASGLAAIAFVMLPSHAESVSWISGRTDMLAAVFMLSSLLVFIRSTEKEFSWKSAVLSAALFMTGLFCKEIAAITPVLFLIYVWSFRKPITKGALMKWLAVLVPAFLIYAVMRYSVLGNTFSQPHTDILASRLIKVGLAYAIYLRMLFIPMEPQVFYNSYSVEPFSNLPLVVSAWLAPLTLIWLAIWSRKRTPVVAFGAAWILISLLLCTEVVPANGLLKPFDHFIFIASVGSSIVIGWLFRRLYILRPKLVRMWPAAMVAVGISYLIASVMMATLGAGAFQSNLAWARCVARQKPHYWMFRSSAAMYLSREGELAAAAREYEAILDYGTMSAKDEAQYAYKLGLVYAKGLGDADNAARNLKRAVKRDPGLGEAWRDLGMIKTVQGELYDPADSRGSMTREAIYQEAVSAYEKASRLVVLSSQDHLVLGRAYKILGQKEKADREFREVVNAEPSSDRAKEAEKELGRP